MAINLNYFKTRIVRYPVLTALAIAAVVTTGLNSELSKSDWAAWAQAIGAFCAIYASGAIATRQSKRQFEDAQALHDRARLVGHRESIEAILKIVDFSNRSMLTLIRTFGWDRETFCEIATGHRHFDRNRLKSIRCDLDAISLHEVPNAELIGALINLRSFTRQIDHDVERAMDRYRDMSSNSFLNFFEMLTDGHAKMCMLEIVISQELKAVTDAISHLPPTQSPSRV